MRFIGTLIIIGAIGLGMISFARNVTGAADNFSGFAPSYARFH
jgi:hypothetical protein